MSHHYLVVKRRKVVRVRQATIRRPRRMRLMSALAR